MVDDEKLKWTKGATAASNAIAIARQTGDWDALDVLAVALGIGDDPEDRGAWDAVCEALCLWHSRVLPD